MSSCSSPRDRDLPRTQTGLAKRWQSSWIQPREGWGHGAGHLWGAIGGCSVGASPGHGQAVRRMSAPGMVAEGCEDPTGSAPQGAPSYEEFFGVKPSSPTCRAGKPLSHKAPGLIRAWASAGGPSCHVPVPPARGCSWHRCGHGQHRGTGLLRFPESSLTC